MSKRAPRQGKRERNVRRQSRYYVKACKAMRVAGRLLCPVPPTRVETLPLPQKYGQGIERGEDGVWRIVDRAAQAVAQHTQNPIGRPNHG